ncbi:MAG: epoxyqueuosine reductase QueH [Omnitrophica bacterium]|nr:epoxyqueuosine reductase QueH [Candidatus Omnitrophota bacterium]
MKILLHICCAVCATSCLEKLRQENHEVSGYFYNPNIQPSEEYLKRLGDTKEFARQENFPLIVGDYEVDQWLKQIKGLEIEPEGGRRCLRCFQLRLRKTAKLARQNSFDSFTTTLTVSPHKNAKMINEIGHDLGDNLFLERDFKKQDGFKKAQELAKRYNLYHQDYCGCTYGLNQKQKR